MELLLYWIGNYWFWRHLVAFGIESLLLDTMDNLNAFGNENLELFHKFFLYYRTWHSWDLERDELYAINP